jgi:RimJ/RimL family protein N-acetyltransferase
MSGRITLRPARFVDCLDVYRWNFAPDVRAQSNTQIAVSLCEHSQWFSRRLRSSDPIWIVEEDGRALGVVRLDREGNGARISIALASDARGRSIGRQAIELACRMSGYAVTAEVAVSNTASQKCFEACGFTLADRTSDRFTYRWSA